MNINLYSDDPKVHELIAHNLFHVVSERYSIPYHILASKKRSRGAIACRDVAYQTAVSMFLMDFKQAALAFGVSAATISASTMRSLDHWDHDAAGKVLGEVFSTTVRRINLKR